MLTVTPVRALSDNYIWLLQGFDKSKAAVVCPGESAAVLKVLHEKQLELSAILVTHNHSDHVNGIKGLMAEFPDAVVYGPASETVHCKHHGVREGDVIEPEGLGVSFSVMDIPGHTAGHVAYYRQEDKALFCGDTLFAAGCGRVFNGTLGDLSRSLQRLATLPPETLIYCAHEYTVENLGFALWVEPENPDIQLRDKAEEAKMEQGIPTVPSTMALELKTNPFLRTSVPEVMAAAQRWAGEPLQGDEAVFAALRTWKDRDYD
ncbi:MAG: hydroxyacylglutathione hydrolase [bacterium]